jgi:Arc/MetJ-type ribon-helix-helix transcriptional regulator
LAFLQDLTTLKDHIDEGNYASSNQFIKEVLRRMISTYQPQQIAEKCKIK